MNRPSSVNDVAKVHHPSGRARTENGAIAVYVALMLPVLFIFVAIAVDISRWYVELQRIQRAADAGALASAPFMPSSLAVGTPGYTAAQEAVERNGYTMKSVSGVANYPTRVSVTVDRTVTNSFAGLIGFSSTTLARTAVADFAGPIAMGSPCNLFGREDMEASAAQLGSDDCSTAGKYWVNIAGTNTNKARGDGYSSSWCTRPDDGKGIDNCGALPLPVGSSDDQWEEWAKTRIPTPQVNQDYPTFPGYVFKVRAKSAGALTLEGYDIGWVATGDSCDYKYPWPAENQDTGGLLGVTQAQAPAGVTDAATRYARGAGPFCTGDTIMENAEGDRVVDYTRDPSGKVTGSTKISKGTNVKTVVTVRAPSDNPYTPLAGSVLCTLTLPGWNRDTPVAALQSDALLGRTYHRWANILQGGVNPPSSTTPCPTSLTVKAGEDYSIQVQTFGGGGQNRFSLRASLGTKALNKGVSIFAVDKVSLFNNVPAGTSLFNLVRLESSAAAHTLNVRFYDLGDATEDVTATVLQPDSDIPFTSCTGEGPKSGTLAGCSVVTKASTNGGRWQTIKIPIAQNYTCTNDDDQSQCWVRIRLSTTAGQSDTTTWAADLVGDPVRIVK